ncbi:MAG: 8-oxo-dGTP diphosphatase [Trueperaceae bacterium]
MNRRLATLVYVRRGGNTLMLRRGGDPNQLHAGKWNGLGGKLEPGEAPEACMRREVLEESGLTVHAAELKGFITFPRFERDEVDWYVWVYVVHDFSGTPTPSSEGDLFWIPDEKLTELPLWEGDRHFMPWLDRPGVFSAVFEYEGGRYLRHTVEFYGA